MESLNRIEDSENNTPRAAGAPAHQQENEETEFENPNVDPGFESSSSGEEQGDQEINKTEPGQDNDALNYKNDREHGAYNPKHI